MTAWSLIDSPSVDSYPALYSVDASSANDIWIVGDYTPSSTMLTLVEHFTSPCNTPTLTPTDTPVATATPDPCAPVGTVVPSPDVNVPTNELRAVSASGSNDVWAVRRFL